jgi:fructosamine-3-kinase
MTELPATVRRGVEEALTASASRPVAIRSTRPLGGGCINPSARLDASDGAAYFLKWNAAAPPDVFEAEADGLAALRSAGARAGVRVPEVMGVHTGSGGQPSWLLLEFVARGPRGAREGEALGRGLAELHRGRSGAAPDRSAGFGWRRDNYIGSLPQRNPVTADWAEFWRDWRLLPQLVAARPHFRREEARSIDRLLDRVGEALAGAGADGPSLLHGDLWSGNVFPGPGGESVLIDPAAYRGHREVDLAMSELFGGFPTGFLSAYNEAWPLPAEYRRVRRPLYQLYYLLVHVNLFGGSYVEGTLEAARSALSEL